MFDSLSGWAIALIVFCLFDMGIWAVGRFSCDPSNPLATHHIVLGLIRLVMALPGMALIGATIVVDGWLVMLAILAAGTVVNLCSAGLACVIRDSRVTSAAAVAKWTSLAGQRYKVYSN